MTDPDATWRDWTEAVAALREDFGIPGVAVAMLDGAAPLRTAGFGVRDIRSQSPVTSRSFFHIASTQKPMTSLFIATLVDAGRLGWDTPVVEIVPQFRLSDAASTRSVTIRHLLSMSSGIPAEAEDDFDAAGASSEDLFGYAAEIELYDRPGEYFAYSNISYALAGYIGALAAGARWGQLESDYARLVEESIFRPAGMMSATFSPAAARASADCCAPHTWRHERVEAVIEPDQDPCDALAPAGAARVNVEEMARYLAMELAGGVGASGQRLVSPENLQARWQPQITDEEGRAYGLGWGVDKSRSKTVIAHEGTFGGFLSLLAMIPEMNSGVVVLANLDEDETFIAEAQDAWLDLVVPKRGIFGWFS